MKYKEIKIEDNIIVREFETFSEEFEWHRDRENRIVEWISGTDWYIQLDNELPKLIKDTIFIPKETWHRIIKGSDVLKVKITKLD